MNPIDVPLLYRMPIAASLAVFIVILLEVALMSSVNAVIDMHTERITAGFDSLPAVVFWTLLLIAAVAVMIGGYTAGLSGMMCRYHVTAFLLVLAATIHLIVDFDRSMRGFITVNQKPLISTIADMEASLAN
jgi:hypothetical protein